MTIHRTFAWFVAATVLCATSVGAQAQSAQAPEALIKTVSTDVLDAVKADKTIQAGDVRKVTTLVDQKVLPYVDFQRMTASAVGRYWKQATPSSRSACRTNSSSCSCARTPARWRR